MILKGRCSSSAVCCRLAVCTGLQPGPEAPAGRLLSVACEKSFLRLSPVNSGSAQAGNRCSVGMRGRSATFVSAPLMTGQPVSQARSCGKCVSGRPLSGKFRRPVFRGVFVRAGGRKIVGIIPQRCGVLIIDLFLFPAKVKAKFKMPFSDLANLRVFALFPAISLSGFPLKKNFFIPSVFVFRCEGVNRRSGRCRLALVAGREKCGGSRSVDIPGCDSMK